MTQLPINSIIMYLMLAPYQNFFFPLMQQGKKIQIEMLIYVKVSPGGQLMRGQERSSLWEAPSQGGVGGPGLTLGQKSGISQKLQD